MSSISTYTLTIQSGENKHSLDLKGKDEFDKVKELCEDRTNMAGWFKASVMPIRTNLADLAKDLFLPTLVNGAFKIDHLGALLFAGLFSFAWDVATLPMRIITLIPRAMYNASITQKDHPLVPYLKEKRVPEELQKSLLHFVLLVHPPSIAMRKGGGKDVSEGVQYKVEVSPLELPVFNSTPKGTVEIEDGAIKLEGETENAYYEISRSSSSSSFSYSSVLW